MNYINTINNQWHAASQSIYLPTANLINYYDGFSSNVVKDSSNLVSSWSDISGKSNNAVQSNTSQQPTYITTNGLPGLKFTGNTRMKLYCTSANVTLGGGLTVAVVANVTSYLGTYNRMVTSTGEAGNIDFRMVIVPSGTTIRTVYQTANSSSGSVTLDMNYYGEVAVYISVGSLSSSTPLVISNDFYINNLNTEAASQWNFTSSSSNKVIMSNVCISAWDSIQDPTSSLNGTIHSVLIYNRNLSNGETLALMNYLKNRWKVS